MSETTGIAWCKSTLNFWIGCTKVGPGCDNCYAEAKDARKIWQGKTHWGPGVKRMRTSVGNWGEARKWNRKAPQSEFAGRKGFWPVFTCSLADVFDNEVEPAWRAEAFALIRECSNLTFLMLTKRIGNVLAMIEQAADYHFDHGDRNVAGWLTDWYKHGVPPANVWLGATVVTQEEASRDVPKLLAVPARVRFLSCEPLLERIVLRPDVLPYETDNNGPIYRGIDWLIIGGESGACARPFVIGWGKELVAQCRAAGVPVFFKQLGSNATNRSGVRHVTKDGKGGDQQEWPTELRVQQFPEVA